MPALVRRLLLAALPFAGTILLPQPARAQAAVILKVDAAGSLVWRGVTLANRPVVDPAVAIVAPWHGLDFTAGLTSNAEPVHYRAETTIDEFDGAPGPLFSMHELSAYAARTAAGFTSSLGASAYLYPRAAGLAAAYNTVELHGALTLPGAYAPKLAANYDVGRVGGAYFELSGARTLLARRAHPLTLAAVAGWSAGQGQKAGDETDAAYFSRDGFTHAELAAATVLPVGRLSVTPALHVVYAGDAWAREVALGRERTVKAWAGVSVAWTRPLGHAAQSVATAARAPAPAK